MNRGRSDHAAANRGRPNPNRIDHVAKATAAWSPDPPAWVLALANEANRASASAAAARIGYSPATLSQVLSATYRGDLARVEAMVRGAFMGAEVSCPVLGEIGQDRCRQEQREPFRATSAHRARLFHACKTCPNREGGAA